jgi:4a-hydroxytetrahydrobiopterin dehydratase
MSITTLTGQQIADEGLTGWAYLLQGLQTRIRTNDFATGLAILNRIASAAEEMDHHPDLDLRYSRIDVRLSSHDAGGVTDRDVRLAREISAIAHAAGGEVECDSVSRIEYGLDSAQGKAIAPFWAAVLGAKQAGGEGWDDVADPYDTFPLIWFQPSEPAGPGEVRQRWHPDVWIDPSQVQPRIDAALAASGTLVSDERAPMFWILADPDGNKVCLCTWQQRD